MEKVEQYIREKTNQFSNEDGFDYIPWLTPDHARCVAEIARQETIKEICEWIKKNVYSYTWCEFQQQERGVETGKLIEDLKKHFEENNL